MTDIYVTGKACNISNLDKFNSQTSPPKPTLNPSYSQITKKGLTLRACDPEKEHVITHDL
jgi:hypothetical protein